MEMQFRCCVKLLNSLLILVITLPWNISLSSARCKYMKCVGSYAKKTGQIYDSYNTISKCVQSNIYTHDVRWRYLKRIVLFCVEKIWWLDNRQCEEKEKSMLEIYLSNEIDKLRKLERKIDKDDIVETENRPTISLRPISYEISSKRETISAIVQEVQGDIIRIWYHRMNENGRQIRTWEHFVTEILSRVGRIKNETWRSETESSLEISSRK